MEIATIFLNITYIHIEMFKMLSVIKWLRKEFVKSLSQKSARKICISGQRDGVLVSHDLVYVYEESFHSHSSNNNCRRVSRARAGDCCGHTSNGFTDGSSCP